MESGLASNRPNRKNRPFGTGSILSALGLERSDDKPNVGGEPFEKITISLKPAPVYGGYYHPLVFPERTQVGPKACARNHPTRALALPDQVEVESPSPPRLFGGWAWPMVSAMESGLQWGAWFWNPCGSALKPGCVIR